MQQEVLGIKETKELLIGVIGLIHAGEDALEDKKLTWGDVFKFWGKREELKEAFDGIDKVIPELKDLDEAELADLQNMLEDVLDLEADKIEQAIEASFRVLGDLAHLAGLVKKKQA